MNKEHSHSIRRPGVSGRGNTGIRSSRRRGRKWSLVGIGLAFLGAMASGAMFPLGGAGAAGPSPIAVTPFAGFNPSLTRAPYVTDLTQTSADVNWATTVSDVTSPGTLEWGPLGNCTAHVAAVPSSLPNSFPASGTPASVTAPAYSVVSGTTEYQATVVLTGLSPDTAYCYRPLGPGTPPVDLLGTNPSQNFTTLTPAGASSPLTFDVMGDLGETLYSSSTPFPNNLNTDQAAIDSLIGQSATTAHAKFVVTAGDVAYSGGTQANYGDLQNTGSEVSDIFGPSYWPQTGGLPVFAGEGNHGQNAIGLHNWPEAKTAQASSGVYAYDSYPALPADGSTAGTYPDAWYAVSDGNVRIYVLDAAWADGNAGTTGTYQVDHDQHWTPSSPEYKWLAADLASHPGAVKMAVFHYPLRSDNSSETSDTTLQNTGSNPSSLEALLSSNGVQLAFNGHAHTYQRIAPRAAGQITNYVTGGGGAILEPVSATGSSACTGFTGAGSIYALGWSPTSNTGTACGTGVPTPQSAAQVFNYLQVSVNGGQVTVTPINAAGQSFDSQTYTYSVTPTTVIDTPPPALTDATNATIAFHATGGSSTFTCKLDTGVATACTSPVTYTGLASGSHTVTVTGNGTTPATATWTVDTTAPTVPTGLSATASSSTQVDLAWTASTDTVGVTGYDIYRNGTFLATTSGTGATYSDASVTGGRLYSYTVDARDGAGNISSQSTAAGVTTPTGPSGPTLVQTAGSSTTTVNFPAPSTPGDLLVLSAGVFTGASKPISAVSDGKNVWTKVMAKAVSGENSDGELWYAPNAASVQSVTVTTGASTVALQVQEFNGVATTSPIVDTSAGTAATSASASSGTVTPAAAGELAVGFIAGHSSTQAVTVSSAGYTAQPLVTTASPSKVSVISGYQDLASTGTQSFAGTFSSAMYWAAGVVLFKAGAAPPPPGDFSLAASPSSASVTAGSSATSTISTATVSGTPQMVGLTSSGAPTGALVSFSPSSVTSGGTGSTMTLATTSSTPAGTYPITVTGTGTGATHTTTVTLTVDTPPAITSPATTTFTQGSAGTFTVTTTGSPAPALTETGALPTGVTLTDKGNGTATLAGTPASGTAGSYPISIVATGAGNPATQSFSLVVDAQPSDFSVGVSPTTATVTAGSTATATVSTATTIGSAQSVALSESGVPAGWLAGFTPQTVTSGSSSTLSVTPSASAAAGTYPVTITGTGTTTHSTTFTLTVDTPPAVTSPATTTFTQGVAGTFTVTTTGSPAPAITHTGALPTGVTLADNGNGTATLAGTPAVGSNSSYPITITATGAGSPASQSFTLTVSPPSDFTIALQPTTATVTAGSAATATVSTTAIGTAPNVALSASGQPTGALVSFNPGTVTAGGSATMSVTTSSSTPAGTYTVTVTGTSSAAVHAATFSLTVNAVVASTPHLAQTAGATETAAATSLAGTFPSTTTSGDLLVLAASEYSGATNHLTSVTDTAGNIWIRVGTYFVSSHNSNGELWYSANAKPTTTVTAHVASSASMSFEVLEFSGVAASNPLDSSAGTSNTGTSAGSGAATSTVTQELAIGFVAGHASAQAMAVTAPGYTDQAQQTTTGTVDSVVTGYQVLGAPGLQAFSGSFGAAMYWASGIALFKPSG
jgi:hypothetical protein